MSTDRYKLAKEIVDAVLSTAPHQRQEILHQKCGDDQQLKSEVESYLEYCDQTADFMTPPLEGAAVRALFQAANTSLVGERIGSYQLGEMLASGGMGTVYKAFRADNQFEKQVAIKLIRKEIATDQMQHQFLRERQMLAHLEHPHIARLYDGGVTEEGLPYLVMEYIDGQPITEYCDEHRLTVEQRLQLFLQVCSAVQYAHQNLIIHGDLKPGNILATSEGTPKLVDFGVALLLEEGSSDQAGERSAVSDQLSTPQYASPEQVRCETMSTVSDVYSLGVILYELLCGRRPYSISRRTSHAERKRIVCQQEVEAPSAACSRVDDLHQPDGGIPAAEEAMSQARETTIKDLRSLLKGDLDAVVLKALRKNPEQRYISVEQLSEDLRRYLAGFPVAACQDTLKYRSIKYLRRNKGRVIASTLIVILLFSGIVGTGWLSLQVNDAEVEVSLLTDSLGVERVASRRQRIINENLTIKTVLEEEIARELSRIWADLSKVSNLPAQDEILQRYARETDQKFKQHPGVQAALQ